MASRKMSQEQPGQTLQATALVHEAFIRLVGSENQQWSGRTHFFAAAAESMRRILIENALRKKRYKHGRGQHKVDLEDGDITIDGFSTDIIDLDEAPLKLAKEDKQVAEDKEAHVLIAEAEKLIAGEKK